MALGYIGLYFGLYFLNKLRPKGKAEPAPAVAAASSGGDMPSAESAEFGEWVAQEGNLEKLFSMAA